MEVKEKVDTTFDNYIRPIYAKAFVDFLSEKLGPFRINKSKTIFKDVLYTTVVFENEKFNYDVHVSTNDSLSLSIGYRYKNKEYGYIKLYNNYPLIYIDETVTNVKKEFYRHAEKINELTINGLV